MIKSQEQLTIDALRESYECRRELIRERLEDFARIGREEDPQRFLEELAFCIFAAGTSARHGMRCVERIRPILLTGDREELREALRGQRFYNVRSGFLFRTREALSAICGLQLPDYLKAMEDRWVRREFLATNPDIAGIGMKETSHFLRNVGYRGYAILDKHILRGMVELGLLDSPRPPGSVKRYREIEEKLLRFSDHIGIDTDEMDLLLWSERTGEILK